MKLFIVAFCLLLAVTNGFQPLPATKKMVSKAIPAKKGVFNPRPEPSAAKRIVVKKAAPKKIVTKKPPLDKKKVVAPTAPIKKRVLVVAPTAPGKKIEKKMVLDVKKGSVAPENKKRVLKFFYDKL